MKVSSSGPPTRVIRLALPDSWFLLVGSPVKVAPAVLLASQLLGAPLTGMVGMDMVVLLQAATKSPDGRQGGVRQQPAGQTHEVAGFGAFTAPRSRPCQAKEKRPPVPAYSYPRRDVSRPSTFDLL